MAPIVVLDLSLCIEFIQEFLKNFTNDKTANTAQRLVRPPATHTALDSDTQHHHRTYDNHRL